MTAATHTSPRWWPGRRLRLFVLFGILALLVIRIGFDLWAGRRVQSEVARLEAKYGSLAPSAGWPPDVPDADNRARLVKAAAALVVPGAASAAFVETNASLRDFKARPDGSPVPDDLREFVDSNRESLRLVDEARGLSQASWNLDYGTFEETPPLLELRTLSNVLHMAALLNIEAGRPDEAAGALDGGLVVAASLAQEPMLIVQLIRIGVALEQFEGIKELLVLTEPSAAALESLAERLRESREPDPLSIGLMGELRYSNEVHTRLDGGRGGQVARGAQPSFRTWVGLMISRPFMRLSRARYLETMDGLIEIQAGPRPRPAFEPPKGAGPLGGTMTGFARAVESGDQFGRALGVAELGVASRRYRLAHGTYPDELNALVPAYLPGVPIDPFTGQPPVYFRQGEGFTLRAEGGDGEFASYAAIEWAVGR